MDPALPIHADLSDLHAVTTSAVQVPAAPALGLDAGDPAVALIAWALTLAVGRMLTRAQAAKARTALPMMAAAIAVGLRAAYAVSAGQPLTVDVVARGFGAAAVAVFAHSQARELAKIGKPGTAAPQGR